MRRVPVILALTLVAVPALAVLPTVQFPAAGPKPVPASIATVQLAGVDAPALAARDNGASATRAASALAATAARSATGRLATAGSGGAGRGRPLVLTRQLRTARFQSLGVTWQMPAGTPPVLSVLVRTRSSHGWSGWHALDTEADTAGDPASHQVQRAGTEPLWVGPGDGVQVRVDHLAGPAPRGLRVELIDPGTSGYDAEVGRVPSGSAMAVMSQPQIYSRASWGADERRVRAAPTYMATIQAGVLHHTTDTNGYAASQVPAMIRGDYAYHLSRGWNDIGYNFLVDRFGRIWEGRAGGISRAVMGAHAGGFNTNTFGVAALGNFETGRPPAALLAGIERLFAWKLDLNFRDPLGYTRLTAGDFSGARWRAGTRVRLPVVMGHRNVDYTACPGAHLYPYLAAIRKAVAGYMRAAITNPALSSATGGYAGSGTRVTAGTLRPQSWRLTVADCSKATVATRTGSTSGRALFTAGWNARTGTGAARPGLYDLRLDSHSALGSARPWTSTYVITPPAPQAMPSGSATSGAGGFVPLSPARLLDTRSGPVLPLGPRGRIDVPVLGHGGVPSSGVTSVVLAVTELCPSARTHLTAWPTGQVRPGTANLGMPARSSRSATVVVPVGADGKVSISGDAGVSNLVVDVIGYHAAAAAARFLPMSATRVLDTRSSGGKVASGAVRRVSLPGLGGIAATDVTAVLAQVTVLGPVADGRLYANPGPTFDLLHYRSGAADETLALLPVSAGAIDLGNSGSSVDMTVDVVGVWSSSAPADEQFSAVTPKRVFSTASTGGPLGAGVSRDLTVVGGSTGVPADASQVLVDVTVEAAPVATTLTAWPSGAARPSRVDLRVASGDLRSVLVLVPVNGTGKISIRNSVGSRTVGVDIVGYTR